MDGYGSGPISYDGNRRMEIVNGKGIGTNNQIHATQPHIADLPAIPPRPSQSVSKPWSFTDAEMKRKIRIAKYKVYTVEGKVKASLKRGVHWIKNKCSQMIHGW